MKDGETTELERAAEEARVKISKKARRGVCAWAMAKGFQRLSRRKIERDTARKRNIEEGYREKDGNDNRWTR